MKKTAKMLIVSGVLALLPFWSGGLLAQQVSSPGVKQINFNATLSEIKGDVLVYKGNKYIPAKNDMRVKDGNRLMVMKNAKVKLTYSNGCTEVVDSFKIFNVSMDACQIIRVIEQKSLIAEYAKPLNTTLFVTIVIAYKDITKPVSP